MKLIKKLLPVATILTSAAIVAPLTTACGSNGTYKISAIGSLDTHGWASYSETTIKETKLLETYHSNNRDHKEDNIFFHDVAYASNKYINWLENSGEYISIGGSRYWFSPKANQFDITINDIQFNSVKPSGYTKSILTISFHLIIDANFDESLYNAEDGKWYATYNDVISVDEEVVNLPLTFNNAWLELAITTNTPSEETVNLLTDMGNQWHLNVKCAVDQEMTCADTTIAPSLLHVESEIGINRDYICPISTCLDQIDFDMEELLCSWQSYYFSKTVIEEVNYETK